MASRAFSRVCAPHPENSFFDGALLDSQYTFLPHRGLIGLQKSLHNLLAIETLKVPSLDATKDLKLALAPFPNPLA
jgi:hypothetical protein